MRDMVKKEFLAFVGGLDLCDGRYDSPHHPLFRTLSPVHAYDFRNPTFTGTLAGCPREQWHDMHSKINGPATCDLMNNFEERWLKASKHHGLKKIKTSYDDALLRIERVPEILGVNDQPYPNDQDPEGWHIQKRKTGYTIRIYMAYLTLNPNHSPVYLKKDLIRGMLERDVTKRMTAHAVLNHHWIQADGVALDKPLDFAVLSRLKQFAALNKVKKIEIENLHGVLDLESEPWPSISEGAKDLIRGMLERDVTKRMTAHAVLNHHWIQADGVALDKPLDSDVLSRLKQFAALNKVKKIAIEVIAMSLSGEEIAGLTEMFKTMDTDGSNQITLKELSEGLKRAGVALKDSEITRLMEAAVIDHSGAIDYGKFIAAMLDSHKIQKGDNLFAAFSYFDKDGSGYITTEELRQACESFSLGDIPLNEVMDEIDKDHVNAFFLSYRLFVTRFFFIQVA
ncbi:putative protein kinase CAMK-CDPK family [Helianthus debilis subsp. tardiflorus]